MAHGSLKTHKAIRKSSIPARFVRLYVTQTPYSSSSQTVWSSIISLFLHKCDARSAEPSVDEYLREKASELREEILSHKDDVEGIEDVLKEKGVSLFRRYSDGSAVVELLSQLKSFPVLALEVFEWRRKQLDYASPMTVEEYTKGVVIAGRLKNVDLAVELFNEASNKQLKSTSLYNALMSTYSYNGLAMKCQSLFQELKSISTCTPSIVTYNILISAFGRLMLVDHMDATLREIRDQNVRPTVHTYKALIAGYITAWMWDEMEKTYLIMKEGSPKPNLDIHLLMLRGYANSGKLEQMEQMYEMVRNHVTHKEIPLIRVMICAYCRSTDVARVDKVEGLLRLIPDDEYRPWLNVILICLYAKQDLLERMENSISEAFERNAYVTTVSTMRCIISSYFRQNAVDKLAVFLSRAQHAGWNICRSLYHCKMVMYGSQMRLSEMEKVIDEMDQVNMHCSKKTFWILYNVYQKYGQKSKLEQVVGQMFKHGYGAPLPSNFV
ncbi:pentatricopeptide repeat-containing protein-like [Dorcoceras hygrometricum]|uniref:Pentatricopeptide repeat-containing protein-like n=1 Tax=Dorcoceras hygrometricum TaxID=472368 RepID=A0A2Z7BKB9_9LAMI|nr:pentatricopeptide repeat-containing protein-like [Dorcoceras hygrometricum]